MFLRVETAATLGDSDDSGQGSGRVGHLHFHCDANACTPQVPFPQVSRVLSSVNVTHTSSGSGVHHCVSLAQVTEKHVDPEMMLLPYLRKTRILCCVQWACVLVSL